MAARGSRYHSRDSRHPLSSLLLFPAVHALAAVTGQGPQEGLAFLLALTAAGWAAVLYLVVRLTGARRSDAAHFVSLAGASASVVCWFPVPETLVFGALAILAAVAVVALADRGIALPSWCLVAVCAATFSFTSTDGLAGLLMLFLVVPRRRLPWAAAASVALVAGAWCVQKLLFPTAGLPLSLHADASTVYLFNKEGLGALSKSAAFLFHAIVMPEIGEAYGFRLSVQGAAPGAGSTLAGAGVGVWSLLLVTSLWSVVRYRQSKTAFMLAATIASQWVVAQAFGVETFFYSSHWGPLFVLLCALAASTPARRVVTALAVCLLVIALLNNVPKFLEAAARLESRYRSQREFTAAVARLTEPGALVLCGVHPGAAHGEPALRRGRDAENSPVADIGLVEEPDTCYFRFEGSWPERLGWIVSYEDWDMRRIETYRRRGARYFVTSYTHGIEQAPQLFAALDVRFRRLSVTPSWAFYELDSPRRAGASPDRAGP